MMYPLLPSQYLRRAGARLADPHRKLMAAVLRTVVEDCRGGTVYRHAAGHTGLEQRVVQKALAYVASTDRVWPYSFENLCDALDVSAQGLRRALETQRQERS